MNPPETDLEVKNKLKLKELCSKCGQPLPEKNKGTITGWIFDNEYKALTDKWICRCGKSDAATKQVASPQPNLVVSAQPDSTQRDQLKDGLADFDAWQMGRKISSKSTYKAPLQSEFKIPSQSELVKLSNADLVRPSQTDLSKRALIKLAAAPPAMPVIDTIEGRWKLLEPIGVGQLGTTYKALSIEEAREVVVKILNENISANPRMAKRFLQECKKSATLHRKHVAAIFDYGRLPDGRPFVVSEYCPSTLATIIDKEGFLDVDEALKLADEICDGLSAAHQAEIIHRGIKPENVLFFNDSAKLADVGVAKALPGAGREAMDLTATSYVFGDPVYTSPEQCQGFRVDERSDIYSLGGVLYHALTGKRPFGSKKGIQLALAQLTDTPRSFERVMFNCDIPEDVEKLVLKCMEKDPLLRYQSIAALQQDIRTLRSGKRLKRNFTKPTIPLMVPLKIRQQIGPTVLVGLGFLMLIPAIVLITALFTSLTSSISNLSSHHTYRSQPSTFKPLTEQDLITSVRPHESVAAVDEATTMLPPSLFAAPQPANLTASQIAHNRETELALKKSIAKWKASNLNEQEKEALESDLNELGLLYERTRNWKAAEATLNELKEMRFAQGVSPDVAYLHFRLAKIAFQNNDRGKAILQAQSARAAAEADDMDLKIDIDMFLGELYLSQSAFTSANESFEKVYFEAKQDSWAQAKAAGYIAYIALKTHNLQASVAKFGTAAALLARNHSQDAHVFAAQIKYAWADATSRSRVRPRSVARSIMAQAKNELVLAGANLETSPYHKLYNDVEKRLAVLQRPASKYSNNNTNDYSIELQSDDQKI